MLTALTNKKIRFDLVIALSASLVFATRVLDRIIMFVASPYLLRELNDIKTKKIYDSSTELAWLALWTQIYYIAVFHLLVIVLALIVFLDKKYRPYKKELLVAYLIIVVGLITINLMARWLKVKG